MSANAITITAEKMEAIQLKSALPVAKKRQAFLDAYGKTQVMILTGETGSGKTTQIPQYVLYNDLTQGKVVAVTQTRRLATTSVAARVAQEMQVELGQEVGYRIRFDRKVSYATQLAFMTDSLLLNDLLRNSTLDRYGCIILDDAHERSLSTDILMALLKEVCHRRPTLKLIVMSATLDATKFQAYFNNAPLFQISGHTYPVDIMHLTEATPNYINASLATVEAIHKMPPGDILVFLPGEDEIERACSIYRERIKDLEVFPLYSALPFDRQQAIFSKTSKRKCIVATNIAETSITINGIAYVVDTGLGKEMRYNARTRQDMLQLGEVSQAAAMQRAGRAGRTQPGKCFRMYTKETFERGMTKSSTPAILTSQLRPMILQILFTNHSLKELFEFDFIDRPGFETLLRGVGELKEMGFVDTNGITEQGRTAVKFSIDPQWVYAIAEARKCHSIPSMTTLAAIFGIQKSIFLRPHSHRHVADKAKEQFEHPLSDHITHLNAVFAYMGMKKEGKILPQQWCSDHFLDFHALEEVLQLRASIVERVEKGLGLEGKELEEYLFGKEWEVNLRKSLAIGLFHNTAIRWRGRDIYRTTHQNIDALLKPNSALVSGNHEWVVYTRFVVSGKQYLETVTAIEPEWIADLPYFSEEKMPKKGTGELVQGFVKQSLDKAR